MGEGVFVGGGIVVVLVSAERIHSLGARVSSGWSASGIVALVSTVAFLPAAEAESFFDTSCSLCGG